MKTELWRARLFDTSRASRPLLQRCIRNTPRHGNRALRRLHGFTLVELLVVIAIIGTLLSLLLPSVQSAREAARRVACQNNLRQVAVAAHLHNDAIGSLPLGAHSWGYGTWATKIMPFFEENQAAAAYSTSVPYFDPINRPVTERRFPTYTCPSDGRETTTLDATFGSRRADGLPKHNYIWIRCLRSIWRRSVSLERREQSTETCSFC